MTSPGRLAARTRRPWLVAALLLGAACQPGPGADGDSNVLTAATLGPQSPQPTATYLSSEPWASADEVLGDRLLMQCRACHTLDAGGAQLLGPNLHGVFGRRAGGVETFGYTAALKQADFVWTPRALDAWLANPSRFLPGNAMAYGGIPYPDDRAALIASLLRATAAADDSPTSRQGN